MTKLLPADEKFGMISQIIRATLSVHLNIAEGASRSQRHRENAFMNSKRFSN
ncbi:MAG: four helix bundle protein [Flavisolibacter sp.]|nr:four helix bundle protein [Flavisolibacter sp.]